MIQESLKGSKVLLNPRIMSRIMKKYNEYSSKNLFIWIDNKDTILLYIHFTLYTYLSTFIYLGFFTPYTVLKSRIKKSRVWE